MSVKERKKERSVWSLLFGFSEEFDDTKNVLSDEAYNKELKETLNNIEKMEKRFEVPDEVKKDKKDKRNQTKQGKGVAKPMNQTRGEEEKEESQGKER